MEASAPPRSDSGGLDYEALRDELRRALARSRLGRFAGEAALSDEDVAQEAIARLIAEVDAKGAAPRDPEAWLFRAATNFVKDRIKLDAIHPTAPHEPSSTVFEDGAGGAALDELVEAKLSQAEYAHIRDLLDREEAALVVLREAGLTVRGAAEVLGKSKSACQERLRSALDKIAAELESRRGKPAERRVRDLATAIVAGTLSASERAAAAREMQYNLALRAEVSGLRHGLHEVATLIPLEETLAQQAADHSLIERAVVLVDRAREQAYAWAGRGSGHEAEAAGGVAAGGASAGLATKAVIAACIGGSAAAGVGGACVATGVVEFPGGKQEPAKEQTVAEEPAQRPATTTVAPPAPPQAPPPPAEPAEDSTPPPAETVKPPQQVETEVGIEGSAANSSPSAGSGVSEFGGPSGGSGGGSSSGGEGFGIE
jgi:DNA-directed RNA polymerase specialized sigma24 family protein